MASKWINVRGAVKWTKLYDADEFAGAKRWIMSFYPENEKEWDVINKAGIQLRPKEDDLGKFISLRRPVSKVFGDDITFFTPPKITGAVNVHYVDGDGNEIRQFKKGDKVERVGEPTLIGNESKVIVNICVYDTRQGKGHRLEAVNVLDLVEYTGGNNKSDAERGLSGDEDVAEFEPVNEAKPAVEPKAKKPTEKKTTEEEFQDSIPW